MSKIRGVNLGEWLVLEKWMDTSIFDGTDSRDEDNLCRVLSEEEKEIRFKHHRDTFITESDIEYIKNRGLTSIRLPVPHFLFGDDSRFCTPYVKCIDYVDKLFSWAEKYNLSVLIDLHTAPESQNGYDNGGICAVSRWAQKKENIARTLDVLSMIAERYKSKDNFLGVELLNEPASEEVWERNRRVYKPHDIEKSKSSSSVPLSILFDFYQDGYDRLRKIMGEDKYIVFHDGFRLMQVKTFIKESSFRNVILDTHPYLEMEGVSETTSTFNHLHRILCTWQENINECQKYVPLMIGEWSVPHNILPSLSPEQRYESYRLMTSAQLMTFETAFAYYFWSYRVKCYDKLGWDFTECIEREFLPSNLSSRA